MPNVLLTISMITREALRILENNIVLAKKINREYESKFAVEGAKIGTVLNVRKPPKYIGRTGAALSVEDSVETSVPLTLNTQIGVDINFSSADLTMSIDDFADRFLKPAVANIANRIDVSIANLYNQINNVVGTPGVIPITLLTYLLAGVDLDNNAAPQDEQRSLVISPLMQAYIVDALKGLFQSAEKISDQYEKGHMGIAAGFTWSMSQNMPTHVVGAFTGPITVTGAGQTGSSLAVTGTVGALKKGDMITIGGVFSINPQSRLSTGQLQKFVVTADTVATPILISPPITPTTASQTVSASPAAGAPITLLGPAGTSSPQGLAFHRDAMTLASADLPLPRGVDMAARVSDDQVGISIRLVRAYDINTDNFPCRLDVLYGVAMLRPELAVRIAS